MERLLAGLLTLLILGHAGIDLAVYTGVIHSPGFTGFLYAENICFIAAYAAALYGLMRGRRWGPGVAAVVGLFGAGRVSRSIVSPSGAIGYLAVQHVPLLLLDLAVGLLGLVLLAGCRA